MSKNENVIVELDNGFTRNVSAVSNKIATSRTKMTANELKAFYQISTLVDKDDSDFREYEISVKEFCSSLDLNNSNRDYVVKLCRKLIRQVFEIEQQNGDYIGYTIFSRMHYKHKEQAIAMKFNDDMRPYLLQLKQFTKIQNIKYIKSFDSKYAIRIYALLKDYRLMSYRDIEIIDLFKMFELPKSYQNYTNLYNKVLSPAFSEINAKSDLIINPNIEILKKQGKKITRIRIHFGNNSKVSADIRLAYLFRIYKYYKGNFDVFLGCKITASPLENTTQNDLQTITKIDVDKNNYCSLYCGNNLVYSDSRYEFVNWLCNAIHRAIVFTLDNEKKQKLDLYDWQKNQTTIEKRAEVKDLINRWKGF